MDVALLAAPPTAAFKGTMCDRVNKFGFFFFFFQSLALKKWCADSSQAMPSANEENLMQITILCLRVSGPDYV